MRKAAFVICTLAWIGLRDVPASAAPIPLSNLISPPQSVTVGGLVFSNFSYSATGDMPGAASVNVSPFVDVAGNAGIGIQGAFLDFPGGAGSDAVLDFRVTASDVNQLITGATLSGNPAVVGGNGIMSATETFLPSGGNASLSIFDIVPPGNAKLSDSINFSPGFATLNVQIDLLAFSAGGVPTLSFIDPTFGQTPGAGPNAPEPTSLALLAAGLAGLAIYRLRWARSRKPLGQA